jgi:hypothetical protein
MMTSPNHNPESKSWDDLARELGLEEIGSSPPPRHQGKADDAEPRPGETPPADDEITFGSAAEPGKPPRTGAETPSASREERVEPALAPRRREKRAEPQAAPPEPEAGTFGEGIDLEESSSAESTAPAEETSDRSRRRGRGRGRPRKDRAEKETAEVQTEGKSEELPDQAPPEDDLNQEEMDTLSDWNVPSWAELIASLYRPER